MLSAGIYMVLCSMYEITFQLMQTTVFFKQHIKPFSIHYAPSLQWQYATLLFWSFMLLFKMCSDTEGVALSVPIAYRKNIVKAYNTIAKNLCSFAEIKMWVFYQF